MYVPPASKYYNIDYILGNIRRCCLQWVYQSSCWDNLQKETIPVENTTAKTLYRQWYHDSVEWNREMENARRDLFIR